MGQPYTVTGVYLQLRRQVQIDGRHQEVLLVVDARQMRQSARLAIILKRRLQPAVDPVTYLARRLEGHPLMRAGPAEGLVEGEVADDKKAAQTGLRDRHDVQLQRRTGRVAPHVLQLDVGAERHRPRLGKGYAEVDLGARARV